VSALVYFSPDSGSGRKVSDMIEGAVGAPSHHVLTHGSERPFGRTLRLENQ
jgi:hypothetical protein